VAVGESGKRPHTTASAVFLYIPRPLFSAFEASFEPKNFTLDKRTWKNTNRKVSTKGFRCCSDCLLRRKTKNKRRDGIQKFNLNM
jgi:hypothetical protein